MIQSVAKGSVCSRMLVGVSVVMLWLLEVGMPKVMPTVGAKFGMPGVAKYWGQFGTRIGVLEWVSGHAVTYASGTASGALLAWALLASLAIA
jgi:hypothetical protein